MRSPSARKLLPRRPRRSRRSRRSRRGQALIPPKSDLSGESLWVVDRWTRPVLSGSGRSPEAGGGYANAPPGARCRVLPTGVIRVRKYFSMLLFVVLVATGVSTLTPAAQAADTGNTAPQTGKIVSDEPSALTPDILDRSTSSITKVGNQIIVGGQFTQVQNANTSTTLTRVGVLAFNATTGQVSTTFAPNPLGTVYK